jgi:hypothetical protein
VLNFFLFFKFVALREGLVGAAGGEGGGEVAEGGQNVVVVECLVTFLLNVEFLHVGRVADVPVHLPVGHLHLQFLPLLAGRGSLDLPVFDFFKPIEVLLSFGGQISKGLFVDFHFLGHPVLVLVNTLFGQKVDDLIQFL